MAFISDAGREFLANQPDEPGMTQKEHDASMKQIRRFESWSRREAMAEIREHLEAIKALKFQG